MLYYLHHLSGYVPILNVTRYITFRTAAASLTALAIGLFLGPIMIRARSEGYQGKPSTTPAPYHGYYYRILTAQGKDAPGGAYSYLVKGKLIGGFALVAYPAEYGNSGVMTFIINYDGKVFQKNLGSNTASTARGMKEYNPDKTWAEVKQ